MVNENLTVPGEFFGLPGLLITKVEARGNRTCIFAETVETRDCCPVCGVRPIWKHTPAILKVWHTPMNGLPCQIQISRQRWRCKNCGHVEISALPPCVSANGSYTNLLAAVLNRVCLCRKLTDLEIDYGLSAATLHRYSVELIKRLDEQYRFPLPSRLGFDEVKIGGHYRTTITNLDRRALIDLLEARQGPYIVTYFENNYSFEERSRVMWICTDMWRAFHKHLSSLFPNAKWVVDKWHVQKGANEALETIRKNIGDQLPEDARKKLKKQLRFSLLTRANDPRLSQERKLALEADLAVIRVGLPPLFTAYGLKEEFFNIYEHGVREEAVKAFEAWEDSIPPDVLFDSFRKLGRTVKRNLDHIFNYWDSGNLTNAFTECENGLIRATDRAGRGYKFPVLRGRVLYNPKALEAAELRGVCYGANIDTLRQEMAHTNSKDETEEPDLKDQD